MIARGKVYKRGDTWFQEVTDRAGKVVLADNTGNWQSIFDQCRIDVAVVRRIEGAGHRLQRSYPDIVATWVEP